MDADNNNVAPVLQISHTFAKKSNFTGKRSSVVGTGYQRVVSQFRKRNKYVFQSIYNEDNKSIDSSSKNVAHKMRSYLLCEISSIEDTEGWEVYIDT